MFLFKVVGGVKGVCGTTARRTNDSSPELLAAPGRKHDVWAQFRLNNTNLASLSEICGDCGLGTIEEAYFCMIPAFSAAEKLPYPHEAYSEARKASEWLEKEGEWEKACEINSWLYCNSRVTNASPHEITIIQTHIKNRLLKLSQMLATDSTNGGSD